MECLSRPFDVRTINLPLPDLGWGPGRCVTSEDMGGSFHLPVIGKIEDSKLETSESVPQSKTESAENQSEAPENSIGKRTLESNEGAEKKQKTGSRGGKRRQTKDREATNDPSYVFKTGLPPTQIPGHTGFLTFASCYPQ